MNYLDAISSRGALRNAAAVPVLYAEAPRRGSALRNPLAVRSGYRRKQALQRTVTRYYEECLKTAPAKFKGQRRKQYCAGVAWKRVRASGKFNDYFRGVRAASSVKHQSAPKRLAMAKRRRGKRDSKGRFVKKAKRRHARAAATETPKRRRRHRRAKAAAAPKRRRHRRAKAVAAPRRRRRRSHRKARAFPMEPRRRSRRRRSHKRASAPRKIHVYRKKPVVRRRRRRVAGKRRNVYTVKGRSKRDRAMALANPLTGAELVVGGITGVIGYIGADLVDRLIATHALTSTTGATGGGTDSPAAGQVYNYQAVAAPMIMDLKRLGAGLGGAAVPIVVAGFIRSPMWRSSLQFLGVGWGLRTLGKVGSDLLVKALGTTPTGMQLYANEISAANALKSASATGAPTLPALAPVSLAGAPQGLGCSCGGKCSKCASAQTPVQQQPLAGASTNQGPRQFTTGPVRANPQPAPQAQPMTAPAHSSRPSNLQPGEDY